jgi:hypothetical protein
MLFVPLADIWLMGVTWLLMASPGFRKVVGILIGIIALAVCELWEAKARSKQSPDYRCT